MAYNNSNFDKRSAHGAVDSANCLQQTSTTEKAPRAAEDTDSIMLTVKKEPMAATITRHAFAPPNGGPTSDHVWQSVLWNNRDKMYRDKSVAWYNQHIAIIDMHDLANDADDEGKEVTLDYLAYRLKISMLHVVQLMRVMHVTIGNLRFSAGIHKKERICADFQTEPRSQYSRLADTHHTSVEFVKEALKEAGLHVEEQETRRRKGDTRVAAVKLAAKDSESQLGDANIRATRRSRKSNGSKKASTERGRQHNQTTQHGLSRIVKKKRSSPQ